MTSRSKADLVQIGVYLASSLQFSRHLSVAVIDHTLRSSLSRHFRHFYMYCPSRSPRIVCGLVARVLEHYGSQEVGNLFAREAKPPTARAPIAC